MRTESPLLALSAGTLLLITTFGLSGCWLTPGGVSEFDDGPPAFEPVEEPMIPDQAPPEDTEGTLDSELRWSCFYEPTINNDWHDDILCMSGGEMHRPYLLEWDDFVTYEEMMEAANAYEDTLNGD